MTARTPAQAGLIGCGGRRMIELTADMVLTTLAKLLGEALLGWECAAIGTQTALILVTERPDAVLCFTQIDLLCRPRNPGSFVENGLSVRVLLRSHRFPARTERYIKDQVRDIQDGSGQSHDRKGTKDLAR